MVKVKRRLSEPNPIDPNLTSAQTEMEKLEAWIRNFVLSFSLGKLRTVLSGAKFLRQPGGALQLNPFKVVSGLAIIITCDTWKDYKLLVAKNRQLAYKIRKLDPEVDLLMLLSPDFSIMEVTVIKTMEELVILDFFR
ncbi:hypothetical protein H6G76_29765 [Nostoc sp. FACHB-152]|uniref:hypothetical protein n=1 Tax=unclassified Nostoc TaxID=2593658 RepID=UPI001684BC20|nr:MULTISPECIES: hypothetical protein [unclassified Nostoc]MBD2451245.1 hypothetical protein [Nostoc sp. FACHB-152]MBD2473189.1 hypothetical protein [Nostoc sp. FACHB-145]